MRVRFLRRVYRFRLLSGAIIVQQTITTRPRITTGQQQHIQVHQKTSMNTKRHRLPFGRTRISGEKKAIYDITECRMHCPLVPAVAAPKAPKYVLGVARIVRG